MQRYVLFLVVTVAVFLFSPFDLASAEDSPTESKEAAASADEKPAESASSDENGEDKTSADAKSDDAKESETEDSEAKSDDAKQDAEESSDKKSSDKKSSDKADAEKDAKEAKEVKKLKTHTVKPKRLKVDVTLDGTFVAKETNEVALRPDVWTDYEIVEIVPHGEKVREGQTLVKFDSRKLNEAIADLELDQRLSELAIRRDEEELPRLEKTLEMNLADAERSDKNSREDFERYNEIERPMTVKSANFTVKYYQSMVDYEKDELDQLEKMYEADDLTEETEEVVLKRQRNSLEFAEFSLENMKLNRDEILNIRLPRFDISIRESLERAELALARAKLASSLDLNRARYELEQKKQARTKSLDRHAKLLGDRDLMEIEAPADGVVYYGQCVSGRWSDMASQIAKLRPKSNVSPGSVMMTIVDPRPIYVTANFDEEKRPELKDGQSATITPPAAGSKTIDGKVQEISSIPVSSGKFEINFEIDEEELPEWIVAGISCKAKITSYDKKDALAIPKAALRTDEDDPDQHYVSLVDSDDEDAKPERRNVEVGKRSGDDVEITKGLKEGDVVSLEDEKKKESE